MNCNDTFHLIPLRGDPGLAAEERERLEEHLEACETCRQEADALAASMRGLGQLTVPDLVSAEVDGVVAAAMPRVPSGWGGWWSHAAAVLVGVSLMGIGRGCQKVVEVPIEVPVEVPVEVRVDVPTETVVERVIYRDRPVVHPLQHRLDDHLRAANRISEVALAGVRLADRAYARIEQRFAAQQAMAIEPPPQRIVKAPAAAKPSPRQDSPQRTHLEVRRLGGRITLRTRGSLAEVVPVLIDTLQSDEGAVVTAALDRLQSIRTGLGARAVELRPEPIPPNRRSGIRALLSSRGPSLRASELDDPTLWRDWWSRQRASDGAVRRSASI